MSQIKRLSDELTSNTGICIADRELFADYPIHWHEFYELEYITMGSGTVVINDTEYRFSKGSLFFLTPTDFQLIHIDERVKIINVSFKSDWINDDIINSLINGTVLQDYSEAFINHLKNEYTKSDLWNVSYVKQLLNCILIDTVRQIRKDEMLGTKSPVSSPIRRSLRYIRIHFKEQITLNNVAEHIGFSANYFSALFHQEVGINFKTYLVNLRLTYAAKFLSSTDLSVTDICFLSGFNDFANFLRTFKKYYNISPLQYKQYNSNNGKNLEFQQISHSFHLEEASYEILPKNTEPSGYKIIKKGPGIL